MTITEKKVWQKVKTSLSQLGLCNRVENAAGTSVPDVIFCGPPNRWCWVELKVQSTKAEVAFNKYQIAWWRAFNRMGMTRPGLVVVSDKRDLALCAYDALMLENENDFRYLAGDRVMVPNSHHFFLGHVNNVSQWENLLFKYD